MPLRSSAAFVQGGRRDEVAGPVRSRCGAGGAVRGAAGPVQVRPGGAFPFPGPCEGAASFPRGGAAPAPAPAPGTVLTNTAQDMRGGRPGSRPLAHRQPRMRTDPISSNSPTGSRGPSRPEP